MRGRDSSGNKALLDGRGGGAKVRMGRIQQRRHERRVGGLVINAEGKKKDEKKTGIIISDQFCDVRRRDEPKS